MCTEIADTGCICLFGKVIVKIYLYEREKRAPVILVLQLNIMAIISAFWMETLLSNTMSATPTKTAAASK